MTKKRRLVPAIKTTGKMSRLVIRFGFITHGWAKLSQGTDGFKKLLIQTGVPFPHLTSYVVLLGGLAVFIAKMHRGQTSDIQSDSSPEREIEHEIII